MSIKMVLTTILDNYMFRPLLAIFRLSSRELKVLLLEEIRLSRENNFKMYLKKWDGAEWTGFIRQSGERL